MKKLYLLLLLFISCYQYTDNPDVLRLLQEFEDEGVVKFEVLDTIRRPWGDSYKYRVRWLNKEKNR